MTLSGQINESVRGGGGRNQTETAGCPEQGARRGRIHVKTQQTDRLITHTAEKRQEKGVHTPPSLGLITFKS